MEVKNPSDTLKSLETMEAKLETKLYAVKIAIKHLKTNVIHVRSPFAQQPASRFQSHTNAVITDKIGGGMGMRQALSIPRKQALRAFQKPHLLKTQASTEDLLQSLPHSL